MRSSKVAFSVAMTILALVALAGCDAKERESLKLEVANLQGELSASGEALAAANTQLESVQAERMLLQNELVSVAKQRDDATAQVEKLSKEVSAKTAELAALKAKAKAAPKKK